MTQATLPTTSQPRVIGWTLMQQVSSRLPLVLAALCLVPLVPMVLGVILLVNDVYADWAAAPEVPAPLLARLDALPEQALLVGVVALGVSFLVFLLLSRWLRGRMARRQDEELEATQRFVGEIERGNLAARLTLPPQATPLQVQLSGALNGLIDSLNETTHQVKVATAGLSDTARHILEATNLQLTAADEQDKVVTQTTATVNEVRATVTETAERAQSVAETAQVSIDVSQSGEEAVADAIEGMNLIRHRVEDIADNILILSEHTQQIGEIIATVNSIADQSKMLALNASVEAARAGEEGKGFAVVAAEVRSLAEQSREATAQVRDLLSEIQRATNTAVMVTEQGTKGVDRGVELVDRAGQVIRELTGTIKNNATAAVQIAASTRQQAIGMDQLTEAMQTIKEATAGATTSTMQVERSVQKLRDVAASLEQTLARYRL